MMNLNQLKNDRENLSHDAKMVMLRKLLLEAADLAEDNIVPVNSDHTLYEEKVKKEEQSALMRALLLLAGSAGILTILAVRGSRFVREKAKEEKARFEQEQKDLYRKLSQIKGRP